jgi:hypothetical protein
VSVAAPVVVRVLKVVAPPTPNVPPTVALLVIAAESRVAARVVVRVLKAVAPPTPSVPPAVALLVIAAESRVAAPVVVRGRPNSRLDLGQRSRPRSRERREPAPECPGGTDGSPAHVSATSTCIRTPPLAPKGCRPKIGRRPLGARAPSLFETLGPRCREIATPTPSRRRHVVAAASSSQHNRFVLVSCLRACRLRQSALQREASELINICANLPTVKSFLTP